MKTTVKLLIALAAGLGVAIVSIYLFEVIFRLLHGLGVPFNTPYSENPFQPFNRYRALMAGLVGLLTVGLLLIPRLSARRVSYLVAAVWLLSWGVLLLDAFVRSLTPPPTFAFQMDWYLLPIITMALTYAAVLFLLLRVFRLRHLLAAD